MLFNYNINMTVRNLMKAALCVAMAVQNTGIVPSVQQTAAVPDTRERIVLSADGTKPETVPVPESCYDMGLNERIFIPDDTVCTITDGDCIAYASPEADIGNATFLEEGTEVTRTGLGGSLDRVVTEDGKEIYVPKLCAVPLEEIEEEEEEDLGQMIADIAESMLGTPYCYAGASEEGVDCSGLVVYCYAQLGVDLPHYSGSLCSVGTEVELDDLRPGDIICWNNGGGHCGHVGIYVGDGRCIDARGRRDGVIYADLDLHPVMTARRIFE